MNGPAPTGLVAKSLPDAVIAVGEPMNASRFVKLTSNVGNAVLSVNTTVNGSGESIDLISDAPPAPNDPAFAGSCSRLMLKITAAALNGVPSVNVTPVRRCIVHVTESVVCSDSASCGTTLFAFSSHRIKKSKIAPAAGASPEAKPPSSTGSNPRLSKP